MMPQRGRTADRRRWDNQALQAEPWWEGRLSGMTRYDVIVAGLGAMGCATAAHVAARGRHVLGLEQWRPGHVWGSSHGDSRIIREMYSEHPMYVPLVQRAYALWRELQERSRRSLLHVTGGLMVGPEDGRLVAGTLRSAREHGLPHEVLDHRGVAARFPAFTLPHGCVGVFDPHAGRLDPEGGNAAHLEVARTYGADLRFEEPVLSWGADGDGVRVTTPKGTYLADRLCLSVGAYVGTLVPLLGRVVSIERQVLFWLDPDPADACWDAPACPIWAFEYAAGRLCYGFPRLPRGVKASIMHGGEVAADGASIRDEIRPDEVEPLREAAAALVPAFRAAPVRDAAVCRFTNTPDLNFVVDAHPQHPQVLLSSACSGHGYKFATVIGELQADLLLDASPRFDLTPFRLERFSR
jgi:sarcosine oxidase